MPGTGHCALLLVFLVLATTAKFAAFINALSFGSGPGTLGLPVSILQAGLWWWMARGLGIFGWSELGCCKLRI